MTLIAKNKFGFVDGSIKQPAAEDPAHESQSRCDYGKSLLNNEFSFKRKMHLA